MQDMKNLKLKLKTQILFLCPFDFSENISLQMNHIHNYCYTVKKVKFMNYFPVEFRIRLQEVDNGFKCIAFC